MPILCLSSDIISFNAVDAYHKEAVFSVFHVLANKIKREKNSNGELDPYIEEIMMPLRKLLIKTKDDKNLRTSEESVLLLQMIYGEDQVPRKS